MLKTLLRSSVLMLLLFHPGIRPAYAQNFVPPQAFDFIFNGPNITWTEDISCYSFRNETPTAWGDVDVYLAGWGMNKGEVTVQFTRQGDPTDIKYQGTIPYVTGFNIAVGATFNQNTNAMQVLVAYERDGFKLDIYDITTSSGNPLALNTTLNLTNDPLTTFARRRIRMDSHRDWAAVIWDYPNHGIQAIGCKGGNWGNIIDVQNTYGYEGPDVAISEVNGERRLQMVYLMPPTSIIPGIIRCESLDFNTLMTSSSTATPFGGSNFHVVSTPVNWGYPNLVIDSKDYDDHENWAFVGTYPNVPFMYVSYHFDNGVYPPGNGIMAVNSGLLGNANISGMFSAVTPSIHFGGGPYGPDQVMMGWYASNNTYQGYMGLSMKPDYSGLVSDPDYLLLSNVTSPFQKMSGLAFSKEDKQLAPDHLYAVYFNRQNTTGIYELHHAFHKWDNPVFRTEQELELSTDVVYPNPFSNKIHTTLTAAEDGFVSMQLTDITGRLVAQKSYSVQKGKNACTIDGLQNLIPGTYFLKTKVNGKKATTQVVVKH